MFEIDKKSFGEFISMLRKEKSMTQKDLAAKIQVTDKAVSRWERGLGFPDINTLEPLADALGVSMMELMKSERIVDNVSSKETEDIVKGVVNVASIEAEEKHKIIIYTFATTTCLLSIIEMLLIFKWDADSLSMSANIPYVAIIPGILLVIYGLILRIRGRNTHGVWAIGICLLLVPVILFGAAFLICGIFNS